MGGEAHLRDEENGFASDPVNWPGGGEDGERGEAKKQVVPGKHRIFELRYL